MAAPEMVTIGELEPVADVDSAPFWAGVARRQVLIQHCGACGRSQFPALPICRWCQSRNLSWVPAPRRAQLVSWIVVHHPLIPQLESVVPYIVGLVELDVGSRMVVRINAEVDELGRDTVVEVFVDERRGRLMVAGRVTDGRNEQENQMTDA